jgi:hypothetical protein
VVKSESETRWSAKKEAVKPINNYLKEIVEVLDKMAEDNENETTDTRSDAKQLHTRMLSYDFLILLGFWYKILLRIDRVQKRLQDPTMNFHDAAKDIKALREHFIDERESIISESLDQGIALCQEWNVEVERRQRRKKRMAGEQARDAGLTAKEEMNRVMKGTLDRLHREMNERFSRLHDTDTKFGFLLDVQKLCYCDDVLTLEKNCENFGKHYASDIDGRQLYEEILDCRMLIKTRPNLKLT